MLSKHVLENKPISLFVECEQRLVASLLPVSSDSLRVEWKDTQIEKMGGDSNGVPVPSMGRKKATSLIRSRCTVQMETKEILAAPEILWMWDEQSKKQSYKESQK